jgi:sec-independent protein translocase protein TatB
MFSLSPAKLLVILVIALIVLGPEKLPQMARQIGAAWHDLRTWRSRVEHEVRGTFPNLPPAHEVAQAVRSPLAFLERLADEHEKSLGDEGTDPGAVSTTAGTETNGSAPTAAEATAPGDATLTVPAATGSVTGNGSVAGNGSGTHNGSETGVLSSPGAAPARAHDEGTAAPGALPGVPDDPSMN